MCYNLALKKETWIPSYLGRKFEEKKRWRNTFQRTLSWLWLVMLAAKRLLRRREWVVR
jgi:hypothetical protein